MYIDQIKIECGVHQGCMLSPTLFSVYSEQIFNEALVDCTARVKIVGKIINNTHYANDTSLLAENTEDLQILNCTNQDSKSINVKPSGRQSEKLLLMRMSFSHLTMKSLRKPTDSSTWDAE